MTNLEMDLDCLRCPETKAKLVLMDLYRAERELGAFFSRASGNEHYGPLSAVLVREDGRVAYPVVDGIPILLVPERFEFGGEVGRARLNEAQYAEAYEEMAHYNSVATEESTRIRKSSAWRIVEPVANASAGERASFPNPRRVWLDAAYDGAAQWDAYSWLAPLERKRVAQIGGKGIHAVKFLLGGAKEAWIITPMIGEARCAQALANESGVAEGLRCAVAVGEELPFASNSFDGIYSGGCLHHMVVEMAVPEVWRVLADGGVFVAVEPWRNPLYGAGIAVFGKREVEVHCRPLTRERLSPFMRAFGEAKIVHHGALTRYPLLALSKLGIECSEPFVWAVGKIDDTFCSLVPGLRTWGSSVACLGRKR